MSKYAQAALMVAEFAVILFGYAVSIATILTALIIQLP